MLPFMQEIGGNKENIHVFADFYQEESRIGKKPSKQWNWQCNKCKIMRQTDIIVMLYLSEIHHLNLIMKKHKIKIKGYSAKQLAYTLQKYIMKDKEKLKNHSRIKDTKETWHKCDV